MSENERRDLDRRAFLQRFAIGAAVVATSGVYRVPDIGGWGPGRADGYGSKPGRGGGNAYGYDHGRGRGPVFSAD